MMAQTPVPSFIGAVDDLRHLTAAITTFHNCYDDLTAHIRSVESDIDSKVRSRASEMASNPNHSQLDSPANEIASTPNQPQSNSQTAEIASNPSYSELEVLCISMCSQGLQKYMIANLNKADKLREEVPEALRLAKTPAKFVFESIGKFYLKRTKALNKKASNTLVRDASLLTLECFLLAQQCHDVKIDGKSDMLQACTQWKKRLVHEGGLCSSSISDARGLLMFIACFDLTNGLKNHEFVELIRAGNVKEISGVLKRSNTFVTKISEVIESMVNRKRPIDAVDAMLYLGIQHKLSPQFILSCFLREYEEAWKKNKRLSQGLLADVNEANKKHLSALIDVTKCLKRHNIYLPGWQISNEIQRLKKDIADSDKMIREQTLKTKADHDDGDEKKPPILRNQELKRSRCDDDDQLAHDSDGKRRCLDSSEGEQQTENPFVFELASLFRPSVSLVEFKFPGLPSDSTISQGSDLYRFADAIVDSETHT